MDRHSIIALPNSNLRKRSDRIKIVDKKIKQLIFDMESTTLDWEDHREHELGVALAAVQIDKLFRAIIIRQDFENKENRKFFGLINPEVIKTEGQIEYDYEGCLSVSNIYGMVPRRNKIKVKALDIEGNEIRLKAEGFLARVMQHEIDHTNGILFIDHIKNDDAFFKLSSKGELIKTPHETILKSDILW